MIIFIATALTAAAPNAPAVTAAAPAAQAPMAQMGQQAPKKEECCCKDKMGKEHASHDMDRMHDHRDHAGR
jgi:hypothetical protein